MELKKSGISEWKACSILGLRRSTFQYENVEPDEFSLSVRKRTKELALENKRYGYRRITALLRREKKMINPKRIEKIWKEEKLTLPRKRPKKRINRVLAELPNKALRPNHVWTYDFVFDRTATGALLKMLAIVDEFTRESLDIYAARRINSVGVKERLNLLFKQRAAPEYIRSDNGGEFIANELQRWLKGNQSSTIYITPGHPWENGFAESFNGKFKDECLNEEIFLNCEEAQVVVEQWRQHYNNFRPHSSLGYKTPAEVRRNSVAKPSDN